MTTQRRIQQHPAFILHHRPFRDSSQILDIISREHGKLSLVARGSRGGKSRLRGILRPFMPLSLSWFLKSDLGTLTGAEVNGAPLSLSGDALLSGFYVNELLLHFLHRHDPQPDIFDLYARAIQSLAATESIAACLRHFEIELLRQIGYALNFDHESVSQQALQADQNYEYRVDQGPVAVNKTEGPLVFSGTMLGAIGAQEFDDSDTLRAASRLMREVISFHLGGKELKSRKVLIDVHRTKNS
jgi:DNA repair protein RecO (recombination protein O)